MTIPTEEKKAIIAYRIEKAFQTLKEAKDNAMMGNWSLSANRLYYATFYMVLALNLKNGESTKTHSGTFSIFSKNYIATDKLTKEEGHLYRQLFSMRQTGDYDDLFDWTETDVAPIIPSVEAFIKKLETMI